MLNNEILQLKSYDDTTGREISNVFPITNHEAVKVENDKNLKEKLTEIDNNIEQIDKKIDSHMENHSQNNESTSIDDTTISIEKTWSSAKIEDFIHTNDDVIWSTVQGENLSIDYTKEGYLREVEILGNTIQNEADLSDIQHLGELHVGDDGQPILDSEGREQYKIEVISLSTNLGEYELEVGALDHNTGLNNNDNTKFRTKDFIKIDNWLIDSYQNITNNYGYNSVFTYIFYDKNNQYIEWRNITQLKKTEIPINAKYFKFYTLYREGVLDAKTFQSNVFYSKKPNESYSESKSHKTTLLLPYQLMKIGNISDRLYWDSGKGRYIIEKHIFSTEVKGYTRIDKPNARYYFNVVYDYLPKTNTGMFLCTHGISNIKHGRGGISYNDGYTVLNGQFQNYTDEYVNGLCPSTLFYQVDSTQLIETNITEQILLPCYKDKTHLFVTNVIDGTIKAKVSVDGGKVIQSLHTKNELLTGENAELKATNDIQDALINTTMLATDEMYTILEPLLTEVLTNEKKYSNIVNMYVAMVHRGLKDEDEIPVKYREQVKTLLGN